MDKDRFVELAKAYGGDISRWPEESRPAAQFVASEPWARAALVDAMQVDALFAAAAPTVDPRRAAVAIGLVTATVTASPREWWRQWLMPVSTLAAAGVMGIVFGISTIQTASASAGMGDILVAMLSFSDPMFGPGLGG